MIIDLKHFIVRERPYWSELETLLDRLETDPGNRLTLDQIRRFHYLYQRASADLAGLRTFSAEKQIAHYLESLVARSYGEIHESREKVRGIQPLRWFRRTFPQTFRRHIRGFWLALAIMAAGMLFGIIALGVDPDAKSILMPFSHLQGSPSERIAKEETRAGDPLQHQKSSFSAYLMTHNTRVAVFTLALGLTWGIGTIVMLFYNGVILGAVCLDYILAGETTFLAGWLLPHGVIEIPAILLAGQAGLLLAGGLIGWGRPLSLRARLRRITPDLVTLIGGVAILLVWAGMVEAFLSQYHAPVIPYGAKIGFGMAELLLLVVFLTGSGRSAKTDAQSSKQMD